MIPYGKQFIDAQDIKAVIAVLNSDWLTQGPKVEEFERNLAKACGTRYAVAVSNGTAALHLAYLAAGLKKNDEVITTPNTFAATSNMLLVTGAKPVFADIRLDTYNLDENKIISLITPRTKAIVPVHFAGHPCAMAKIRKIARQHHLLVIEDACHALGAKYKNQNIGEGVDLAVFSFHPVKHITTGEGGAIVTNNQLFYERMKQLRSHGITKDQAGFNVMNALGYNYRLSDIQAALGLSQLKKLPHFLKKRRRVAHWYNQVLAPIKEIILPQPSPDTFPAWHIYVIRTTTPGDRDPLATYLKKNGIGVNFHYPAVYAHPYYRQHGYAKTTLLQTEIYRHSCLTLPCHVLLKKREVDYIAQKIKNFFDEKSKR